MTAVSALESRCFFFGPSVALALGVPFVAVRKAGKLPGACVSISYELEYGEACLIYEYCTVLANLWYFSEIIYLSEFKRRIGFCSRLGNCTMPSWCILSFRPSVCSGRFARHWRYYLNLILFLQKLSSHININPFRPIGIILIFNISG